MYKVYSTRSCGKCMMLKNRLTAKNIPYEVVYLEDSPGLKEKLDIVDLPTLIEYDDQGSEKDRYFGTFALQKANSL